MPQRQRGRDWTWKINRPAFELNVGAFVVATGFRPYEPLRQGEYGYGEYPEVITLPLMIRLLALTNAGDELDVERPPGGRTSR